jgi:replicative DNA helicase
MSPRDVNPEDDGRERSPVDRHSVQSAAAILAASFQRTSAGPRGRGVPCGHWMVDKMLGGFRPEHVTVCGAGTSWGKSSFATQVSDVGLRAGARILLVSGEDAEVMYGNRLLARRANVNAMSVRDGTCTPSELDRMAAVVEEGERDPFFFDARGKSVEEIAKAIREIVAEVEADLVMVDYLQAIGANRRTQDRRNEVTYIARTLVDAIKLSGASGLLFSQLKRMEDNARPTMHDLKESGDVENMAEHVLIGYRVRPKDEREPEKRYLLVEKNKDGPVVPEPLEMPFNFVTASFVEVRR